MRTRRHPAVPARAQGKDRSFFNQHVAFPLRDASPVELERFWAGATRVNVELPPEHHWDCLGPNNVAGRVTALVIHPDKPECWVAGSAAGGVWVTNDAGMSWTQTWSRFAPQSIGALAWTVWDRGLTLIAATGEANMSADTYPGSGLYISFDCGLTWHGMFGAASPDTGLQGQPRRIGSIAAGPEGRVRERVSRREHAGGPLLRGSQSHGMGGRHLRQLGRAQLQLSLSGAPPRWQDAADGD